MTRSRAVLAASALIILLSRAALPQQPSELPTADPARPTVSTPATLPPVGYLQFETGFLQAWDSPEVSSQSSINEVMKIAVCRRLQLQALFEPYAHSRVSEQNSGATGDIILGAQGVLHKGEGAKPTVALGYLRRVYGGDAPDLDIGSFQNSAEILISADVKGFHYDTNYIFNEVIDSTHRAQFGQTLSISHGLKGKFGLSGEIWHITQPFLKGNAVGNLWALSYSPQSNWVLDGGFDHGLTSTSTQWAVFFGFTYLLPKKIGRRHSYHGAAPRDDLTLLY